MSPDEFVSWRCEPNGGWKKHASWRFLFILQGLQRQIILNTEISTLTCNFEKVIKLTHSLNFLGITLVSVTMNYITVCYTIWEVKNYVMNWFMPVLFFFSSISNFIFSLIFTLGGMVGSQRFGSNKRYQAKLMGHGHRVWCHFMFMDAGWHQDEKWVNQSKNTKNY